MRLYELICTGRKEGRKEGSKEEIKKEARKEGRKSPKFRLDNNA
jgi:hypothetical protein